MSATQKSTTADRLRQQLLDFSTASQKRVASFLKNFYDPLKTVNAYNVFWIIVWLVSFAIVGVAVFMESGSRQTRWIVGMAGGIALLTSLGVFFRYYYPSNWNTLSRVESAPDEFDPSIYSGVVEE